MKLGWVIFGVAYVLLLLSRRVQRHFLGVFPPVSPIISDQDQTGNPTMCGAYADRSTSQVQYSCQLPAPQTQAGTVKVRVHYASVNPVDVKTVQRIKSIPSFLAPDPFILGGDIAGVVVDVDETESKFRLGDRVFAHVPLMLQSWGGYAEYMSVSESHLAPVPDGVPLHVAAAVPLVSLTVLTAIESLRSADDPQRHVLITGGAGGVGHIATQLFKQRGFHVTCSASPSSFPMLTKLGADKLIDYHTQSLSEAGSVDIVMSLIDGPTQEEGYGLLSHETGEFLNVLKTEVDVMHALQVWALRTLHAILPWVNAPRYSLVVVQPNGHKLSDVIAPLLSSGALQPIIDTVYPISEVSAAHEHLRAGHTHGKLLLDLTETPSPLVAQETQD